MAQRVLQVVTALIRQGTDILLIRQCDRRSGGEFWSLPGGGVEHGELLPETLIRETREETGLTITDPGRLLYLAQYETPRYHGQLVSYVFDIAAWEGTLAPADPDGEVLEARFLPQREALDCLTRLPWRDKREALVAHLSGEAPHGTLWFYRRELDGTERLMGRVPHGPPGPDGYGEAPE